MATQAPLPPTGRATADDQLTISSISSHLPSAPPSPYSPPQSTPAYQLTSIPPSAPTEAQYSSNANAYPPAPAPFPAPSHGQFIPPSNTPAYAPPSNPQPNGTTGVISTPSTSAQAAIETYSHLKAKMGFGQSMNAGPPALVAPPGPYPPPPGPYAAPPTMLPPHLINPYTNGLNQNGIDQYQPPFQPIQPTYYPQVPNNTSPPHLSVQAQTKLPQKKWYLRKTWWLIIAAILLGFLLIIILASTGSSSKDPPVLPPDNEERRRRA